MSTGEATISARDYHQRTKHSLEGYARGPATLDWDNQPDPFRRFAGCDTLALPLTARGVGTQYAEMFQPGVVAPMPLSRDTIATLLELSLGLSAWKTYGTDRWALRCNPSSGNLHPTEGYLMLADCEHIPAGVYHYLSVDHLLERRCTLGHQLDSLLPSDSFLIGLSSIHWREAWKYGERAFRYCQLDVGHAVAAVRVACAALGWRVKLLEDWSDAAIAACLGLDRAAEFAGAEREAPDVMLLVQTRDFNAASTLDANALAGAVQQGRWTGHANTLNERHDYDWPLIEQAAQACEKPATATVPPRLTSLPELLNPDHLRHQAAAQLIRQRRSAQAFDGVSTLSLSAFCRMLDALLPRPQVPPLDVMPWTPRLHPVFFIHRVEGIPSGLYCLPRSPQGETLLRAALSDQFLWAKPDSVPDCLPFYLLVQANCRNAAHTLSCHQAIAADSAFCRGHAGRIRHPLRQGDWVYRQLFWEAGAIGQSLYLEAEAAGVRGTGIGCYFDDKTHEILGLRDQRLQDLYHFTVGTPHIDTRLVSLPPYSHLTSRSQPQ